MYSIAQARRRERNEKGCSPAEGHCRKVSVNYEQHLLMSTKESFESKHFFFLSAARSDTSKQQTEFLPVALNSTPQTYTSDLIY